MLLDYHRRLDAWKETNAKNIGTTKSGIGPFYKDNADRLTRITFLDYISEHFEEKLREVLEFKKNDLITAGIISRIEDIDEYMDEILSTHDPIRKELKKYASRLEYRLNDYLDNGDHIIIEGAQGSTLDVDMGTLPDVTCSHLLAPHAFPGLGLPRKRFKIYGVEKAYPTRVGNGILPTLDEGDFGTTIVKNGGEFGATTGRQRRVGYPDWVLIRRSVMLNDCDGIFLTRTDVMQNHEIKACVAYNIKEDEKSDETKTVAEVPLDFSSIKSVEYKKETYKWSLWKGNEDLSDPIKMDAVLKEERQKYIDGGFESLPDGLKDYIKAHDEFVGCPIVSVSLGPGREEMAERKMKED
jgi:adenylosuccinate synthase